jgi:putative transposase
MEICCKLRISQRSFYYWKKKHAVLGRSELRESRQLHDENGKLKGLVADFSLDRYILQTIVAKAVRTRQRRASAKWAQQVHGLSERYAARLMPTSRMSLHSLQRRDPQEGSRVRLRELAARRVCSGRLTVLLKREG